MPSPLSRSGSIVRPSQMLQMLLQKQSCANCAVTRAFVRCLFSNGISLSALLAANEWKFAPSSCVGTKRFFSSSLYFLLCEPCWKICPAERRDRLRQMREDDCAACLRARVCVRGVCLHVCARVCGPCVCVCVAYALAARPRTVLISLSRSLHLPHAHSFASRTHARTYAMREHLFVSFLDRKITPSSKSCSARRRWTRTRPSRCGDRWSPRTPASTTQASSRTRYLVAHNSRRRLGACDVCLVTH